jgi:hypothetical protein
MGTLALIGFVLAIVGGAIWTSRTPESKDNGDNMSAASRYGPGAHGG